MVIEIQKEVVKSIKIDSIPENIAIVEQFVEEIALDYSVREEVFGNILIAVTEAANNALYHGNKSNEKLKIDISSMFLESKNTLIFIIKDEGKGFDFDNLPDPTAPENIEKASGRGVFLMKHLSDLFTFSNGGNTIELHFKL